MDSIGALRKYETWPNQCERLRGHFMKGKRSQPQIVVKNGEPTAVILDIDEYQEILERLEDLEALKALEQMRKKPLRFRKFEDFLKEHGTSV